MELIGGYRFGYPVSFVRRKDLLRVLLGCLVEKEKGKVFTSKAVKSIEDDEKDGTTVRCEDGSSYSGDIVVGADGVHSTVVEKMREKIEKVHPGATKNDQVSKTAEYNVSNP